MIFLRSPRGGIKWTARLAAVLLTVIASAANGYETGDLTCENVGQLAAQMLMAKQAGVSSTTYLSELDARLPQEAQVEREIALGLSRIIYHGELPPDMKPEDAFVAITRDCLRDQARERVPQ